MAKPYTFSFSYSRWADWKKCPASFKYKYIDKLDTGPTPKALIEGRKVHDDIAKYLEKGGDMPDRLSANFSQLGQQLRERAGQKPGLHIEKQMAFDIDQREVSWFGPNAIWRFIWDVGATNHKLMHSVTQVDAVDWKTGKPYGSYDDQMQIFAMPAFWIFSKLETFNGYLAYLDTGDVTPFTITREQFYDTVERTWVNNAKTMASDVSFAPTPSKQACRFCDFGPRNLGVCPVGIAT